ncbi:hypothetical protein [Microbacterium sp. NPDC057650]|uniref:hypothetical protein n=1 Tax=unclassified Microbacterium TaxID=2609290 RepID=UPI00366BDA67
MASALLIGLGAGWMLFGRDAGPSMDAEQQKAWTEFEASGKYDAGSIRMLGEQYGITAWYATQKKASTECLMLTPTKGVSIACQPLERGDGEQEGLPIPLSTQVDLEDDKGTVVNAAVVRDVRGVQTAILQQWRNEPTQWLDMFQGDERTLAELIIDRTGKDGFLEIIGYDGETPIWLAQDGETCLYVANLGGIVQQSCDVDASNVVIEMPNATYGLSETNHGTALITLAGHEAPVLGDDGVKVEE